MDQRRALGIGLIGIGAVLGGLAVMWLIATAATGDLRAGGFVLGLMLAAVLGLPPAAVGIYMLQKAKQEQDEASQFVGRRRVLDQDRLFRSRIASEARQQAARLEDLAGGNPLLARAATRLGQVADQLQSAMYDEAAWYESVKLTDQDIEALRQYDTLVSDRLRTVARQIDEMQIGRANNASAVLRQVQEWERDLDRRIELLRGERPPSAPIGELLDAGDRSDVTSAIEALKMGDAVTFEEEDFVVDLTMSYLASGQSWKLHRLSGTSGQRWLYVSSGARSLAIVDPADPTVSEPAETVEIAGNTYELADHGSAGVTIISQTGQDRAVAEYRHYRGASAGLYWWERWPDGTRAYVGSEIRPLSLEIWPAEAPTP